MYSTELTVTDALTTNYPFDRLMSDSDDSLDEYSDPSLDTSARSLDLSAFVKPLSAPSTSIKSQETDDNAPQCGDLHESQPDRFVIRDADDTLLLDLGHLGRSDSDAIATQRLGGLYDDPIEYGNPIGEAYYWRQQQGGFSCAVVAQISVYQSLTGGYISEADASNYAYQNGWFDPLTGTQPQHTGQILNALGIQTYQQINASLSTLEYALAQGDKPIVGLDASEIWNPTYDWYGNPLEQSNLGHAVWVTGIDYEQDGSINIIVNDSGTPNGMASVIGYRDFMNAWSDFNYFVSVADNPFT